MTKTLTEQWKDGKLQAGEYYVKDSNGVEIDGYYPENSWERGFVNHSKHEVKEVLAPVPSYQEFVQQRDFVKDHMKVLIENMNLKRKLEIATKALNGIRDVWANNPSQFSYIARIANRKAKAALEEMEGVK